MIYPRIHLNGTSGQTLLEEYTAAWEAAEMAIDMLKRVTVNGRDYYPISTGACTQATKEHQLRIKMLERVRDEIADVRTDIARQMAGRERA